MALVVQLPVVAEIVLEYFANKSADHFVLDVGQLVDSDL